MPPKKGAAAAPSTRRHAQRARAAAAAGSDPALVAWMKHQQVIARCSFGAHLLPGSHAIVSPEEAAARAAATALTRKKKS